MFVVCAAIFLACTSACGQGLYSLEQECSTGNCLLRAGPVSCVAIGNDPSGGTCVLTAAHCVSEVGNRFFIVNTKGEKSPAIVVARNTRDDIATLRVERRLKIAKVGPRVRTGERVVVNGLLSRKWQESSGTINQVNRNGAQFWVAGMWSHPGMSGSPIYSKSGSVVGILSASAVGKQEVLAAGPASIADMIRRYESRYGRLVVPQQYGYGNCGPCQQAQRRQQVTPQPHIPSPNVVVAPCQDDIRRMVAEYMAANPVRSPEDDYDRIVGQVVDAMPRPLNGLDGKPGSPGSRGPQGATGAQGLQGPSGPPPTEGQMSAAVVAYINANPERFRGAQGLQGLQGERGFVAVPDDQDIRNWLVGAMSDPETRAMMSQLLVELAVEDPRTTGVIQRLEAIEAAMSEQLTGRDRVVLMLGDPDLFPSKPQVTKSDGSLRAVLDSETYGPDDPLVFEVDSIVRAVIDARQADTQR